MIKPLIYFIRQIITILRLTYTISFWKNFSKNMKYWLLLVSKGYISLEKREAGNSIAIQTIFFLFGDINVNIRNSIIASNNSEIVASYIKEMQKFKEQVLFFVPVLFSFILNATGIVFSILHTLKKFEILK